MLRPYLLANMMKAHLDQAAHMAIVERVKDIAPAPLRPYQTQSAKQTKLMRDIRLTESEQCTEITDTERFGANKRLHNPKSVWVSERRKYLPQPQSIAAAKVTGPERGNAGGIHSNHITGVGGGRFAQKRLFVRNR